MLVRGSPPGSRNLLGSRVGCVLLRDQMNSLGVPSGRIYCRTGRAELAITRLIWGGCLFFAGFVRRDYGASQSTIKWRTAKPCRWASISATRRRWQIRQSAS